MGVDPGGDLGGVEAEEVAPLDVGDALLVDEAADVTDIDAELLCDVADADKPTWIWRESSWPWVVAPRARVLVVRTAWRAADFAVVLRSCFSPSGDAWRYLTMESHTPPTESEHADGDATVPQRPS